MGLAEARRKYQRRFRRQLIKKLREYGGEIAKIVLECYPNTPEELSDLLIEKLNFSFPKWILKEILRTIYLLAIARPSTSLSITGQVIASSIGVNRIREYSPIPTHVPSRGGEYSKKIQELMKEYIVTRVEEFCRLKGRGKFSKGLYKLEKEIGITNLGDILSDFEKEEVNEKIARAVLLMISYIEKERPISEIIREHFFYSPLPSECSLRDLLESPLSFRAVVLRMALEVPGEAEAIISVEAGGTPFASIIAFLHKLPFISIPKERGISSSSITIEVRRYGVDHVVISVPIGLPSNIQSIVIIDDMIMTGSTSEGAIKILLDRGYNVCKAIYAAATSYGRRRIEELIGKGRVFSLYNIPG